MLELFAPLGPQWVMQKYKVDALTFGGRYFGMKIIPVLAVLAVLITSCTSSGVVLTPDRFDTEVLEDGSKRFVFEVNFGPSADREGGRGRERSLSPSDMELGLEGYFELHPFCEEGYFVYDRGFNGSAYTMLGECQESAEVLPN